uniref:Uncharacterized protein n=1 Tax=Oryza sativa subsp. indica TaxID=39946 RepID=C5NNV2_ORYSI|nr:hypothetical protein [Oryza sativa Indica Group]
MAAAALSCADPAVAAFLRDEDNLGDLDGDDEYLRNRSQQIPWFSYFFEQIFPGYSVDIINYMSYIHYYVYCICSPYTNGSSSHDGCSHLRSCNWVVAITGWQVYLLLKNIHHKEAHRKSCTSTVHEAYCYELMICLAKNF